MINIKKNELVYLMGRLYEPGLIVLPSLIADCLTFLPSHKKSSSCTPSFLLTPTVSFYIPSPLSLPTVEPVP